MSLTKTYFRGVFVRGGDELRKLSESVELTELSNLREICELSQAYFCLVFGGILKFTSLAWYIILSAKPLKRLIHMVGRRVKYGCQIHVRIRVDGLGEA